MNGKTAKIAVSLPRETLDQVEKIRLQLGLARSAAVDQALKLWVREREESELEERYVKGYAKKPERVSEVEPFFRAGLSSFTPEDW